jgi:uncharacterized protein
MKNVINWFEIYTADLNRAKKFYTQVFKYKLTDLPVDNDRHSQMEYATFSSGENGGAACGALVRMDEVKPGNGGVLIYFASEEIDGELSRVEAAGGKIIRPKLGVGDLGFIAFIEDTEGNMIGLRSIK